MPTYSNISPESGAAIVAADSLSFDVVDTSGLASVFVYVSYADGTTEVVYTGDGFGPRYSISVIAPILDGFTFTLNRVGGWMISPMLRAIAVPVVGDTANLAVDYVVTAPELSPPRAVIGDQQAVADTNVQVRVATLGSGVIGPFRRDGKGDIANASGIELIRSNVGQILGSIASSDFTVGEIPWRPEFGSLLYLLRFRNNDSILRELAEQYVVDALDVWEPRIDIRESRISQDQENGELNIIVIYDILGRSRSVLVSGVQQEFTTLVETA